MLRLAFLLEDVLLCTPRREGMRGYAFFCVR